MTWLLTRLPGRRTEPTPQEQHRGREPSPQSPPPHPLTLKPFETENVEDTKKVCLLKCFQVLYPKIQQLRLELTFGGLRVRVAKHFVLVAEHIVVDIEFVGNGSLQTDSQSVSGKH